MIFAKLNPTGLLTDIRQGPQQPGGVWPDGSQDVPLTAMPASTPSGQYTYDSINQVAVPVTLRVRRTMYAIANDIFALTGSLPSPASGTQKANIISAMFTGNLASGAQQWQQDAGVNGAALSAVYASVTSGNGLAVFNAAQQLIMTAMYVQDNPKFLVNPPFDTSINIPGDQAAT